MFTIVKRGNTSDCESQRQHALPEAITEAGAEETRR
jgi:hypothetical protein